MKKTILTEVNNIKKMMGLVSEQEQVNYSECLSSIPLFYFAKTTGLNGDSFKKGSGNYEGGDLGLWNDNKIPELDDEQAYGRFIEHVKSASEYQDGALGESFMIWNEECGEVPLWEELLPHIKLMYFKTIMEKNRQGEEMTIENAPELISQYSEILDVNDFSDEFEWADNVIENVVEDILRNKKSNDEIYDSLFMTLKDKYGPSLIGFENPFV